LLPRFECEKRMLASLNSIIHNQTIHATSPSYTSGRRPTISPFVFSPPDICIIRLILQITLGRLSFIYAE
ncbi:hypothetical protein FRB95_011738, partial [Tulasnella sp. JGI-2019a]